MSGRVVRQRRQAVARLATIPACDCGHWPHVLGGCAFLRFIAARSSDWCNQCGYRFRTRGSRHVGWFTYWCPKGHAHGSWFKP